MIDLKKGNWKDTLVSILIAEAAGGLSALLTRRGMELYRDSVLKPPLSPPAVVFPIVWTGLYALMGVSAARIWRQPPSEARSSALWLYGAQLLVNVLWSVLFFNLETYGFAFVWLVLLWALIVAMTLRFRELDRTAANLQIPYLIWVLFAGYLNYGVWMLNK